MPKLDINLNGDSAWPDLRGRKVINLPDDATIKIVALEGGMASGKPSIAFRLDLPNGKTVIAQTSARLFVMAAAAIVGKWPDVDDGTMLAHIEKGRQSASIEIIQEHKAD